MTKMIRAVTTVAVIMSIPLMIIITSRVIAKAKPMVDSILFLLLF